MNAQELKHRARLEEWKERVAACRSSGMSVRGWCQEQGIAYKTYYYCSIIRNMKEWKTETRNTETVTISRAEYEELKSQNEWLLEQLRLANKKRFGDRKSTRLNSSHA